MTTSAPPVPDLLSPEHVADPWPGLAVLRDHYPAHWDEATESWLISRYEDIRPLNRACGPGQIGQELLGQYLADDTTVFLAMDGTDHRRRRALLAPYFARGGVENLHTMIERRARALLEPVFERERRAIAAGERERGEMDFVNDFTARFSIDVMTDMLGLPIDDYERIHAWFHAWLGAEGNIGGDPERIARARWANEDFGRYILPIIAERRTSDANDLISWMGRAELDGFALGDDEIRSIAALMILGGGETTDHQLAWVMHELVTHPEQQRALVEDRGLMDRVLAEGMRYCSIVQYIAVPAVEDVEVAGVSIEKGSTLALVLAAGNHDPRRFERPDEFDIHREDLDPRKAFAGSADHLGFGAGPHFCIGSHLSKAEQEIALDVFFEHASDVRLAEGFEPRADPDAPFVRSLPSLKLSFAL
jgi:cytochrome P450